MGLEQDAVVSLATGEQTIERGEEVIGVGDRQPIGASAGTDRLSDTAVTRIKDMKQGHGQSLRYQCIWIRTSFLAARA